LVNDRQLHIGFHCFVKIVSVQAELNQRKETFGGANKREALHSGAGMTGWCVARLDVGKSAIVRKR
jgi:hypothetical protein